MQGIGYNQDEVLSRKDYFKKKKKEKRKNALKQISGRAWFMLAFIILCSAYVIYQFYIYNSKNRLVQTLPDEISSMKDYKIFYVSETYTYDSKNQLKSMSTLSSEKKTINEGLGSTQISVKNNNIYGIQDGNLIKIDTNSKENIVKILVEKNVKGYTVDENDIYVYLNGKGVETGLYCLNSKNELKKVISGEIIQLIVDKNNIYIVNKYKNLIRYDKSGFNEACLVGGSSVGSIIQDDNNVYFVNLKDNNKIYKLAKNNPKAVAVSKTAATVNSFNGMNGYQFMGVYDDVVYYINTKDNNKLYKSSMSLKEDQKVLDDSIQILDIIDSTIFYKIQGDIGVYRYDITNSISSQVTSARVVEFKADHK